MGITIGIAVVVLIIVAVLGLIFDLDEFMLGCSVLLVTLIIVTGCIVAVS